MKRRSAFGALAAWAARHPKICIPLAVLAAGGGTAAALSLGPDAGIDTLVDRDDATLKSTERFRDRFGDDAVVVLVRGDLQKLVLTSDIGRLVGLEGCLSGNAPPGVRPPKGPCRELAELNPTKVVYGPGTFVNEAANQITRQFGTARDSQLAAAREAARRARREAARKGLPADQQRAAGDAAANAIVQQFTGDVMRTALRFGLTSVPALNNPDFVSRLVFDSTATPGTPKARFSYLFPNSRAALISIRMRPDLSESERERAVALYRQAVELKNFRIQNGDYVLSGVPVVVSGLADTLTGAIIILLIAAVAVMALVLAAVFRPPGRLLPLALALAAAGVAFGALSLAGGSLTMASIAVLPVLIGLAVDYAIQFQSRWRESATPEGGGEPNLEEVAREVASGPGRTIAIAGLTTAAGFLVLLLSPVPMVRSFGLLLVVGMAAAFALVLTAGFATLALLGRAKPREPSRFRAPERLAAARTRAGSAISRGLERGIATAITSPGRILAVAVALAATGWVADTGTEVISDVRTLVPRDMRELQDVNRLQRATGVSGELDVMVTAEDMADPKVITWMRAFQARVLRRHGFGGQKPSCDRAEICPAASLPDLFRNDAGELTRDRILSLLEAVPSYFSQAVITRDRSTANIAFGIRVGPLDRQEALISDIRAQIDPPGTRNDPPRGVSATVVGLPVLAAEANDALSGSRYWLTLAGLLAAALVLLVVLRSPRRALVPMVPIALATGWSALVLAGSEIPLNPMSATLGALVIAISTEFSVLLSARYWEERDRGRSVGEALRVTYERTGAAVMASGATAIAGFAALIASDIRMLRDFGFATVFDLSVAVVGVLLVLPAVLVLSERHAEAPMPIRERLRFLRAREAPE